MFTLLVKTLNLTGGTGSFKGLCKTDRSACVVLLLLLLIVPTHVGMARLSGPGWLLCACRQLLQYKPGQN